MDNYKSEGFESTGCIVPIVIVAIIGLVSLCSHLSENSQRGMIKKARNEVTEMRKVNAYNEYLSRYPDGRYAHEAENAVLAHLDRLPFEGTASLPFGGTTLYIKKSVASIEQIEEFKDKYSGSYFANRIDSLLTARVDRLYKTALSMGTMEAWHSYQNMLPEQYWRDSEERIETIKQKDWGTESSAWKTAQKANTITAYNKYLGLYPNGTHAKVADKKIIDLTVSNIFAGDHGSLPGMYKMSASSSSSNTIIVSNDTQYTLTLLYSGPDSKRLVLNANSSSTVRLPNGTYRIAASVAASNVRSYAGTEILSGGRYNVSYYIASGNY